MKTTSTDPTVHDRLDAVVMSWPSGSAREEAHDLVGALCGHPTVVAVVLFGSAVRSNVRSYDLDLLFVYEGDKPAVASRRMEVDLRAYSTVDVDDLLQRGHDLISWAVRFGQPVCERNQYWQRLVSTWQDSLPMPSMAAAERRGEKAWSLFLDLLGIGDIDAALEQYVTYLTHRARIELVRNDVYPASRPELPEQLRQVGAHSLAQNLNQALRRRHLRSEGKEDRVEQFLQASRKIGARFNGAAASRP